MTNNLKENIVRISDLAYADTSVDNSTGISTVQTGLFERSLPEDLSLAQVEQVHNHMSDYTHGVSHAVIRRAEEAMRANNQLHEVTATYPTVGKDNVQVAVERSRTYKNPHDLTGAEITKHGVLTVKVQHHATNNVGQLKMIREASAEMFKVLHEAAK